MQNLEFTKEEMKYYDYVIEHKRNVIKAYNIFAQTEIAKKHLKDGDKADDMKTRVLVHDGRKLYYDESFAPYCNKFICGKNDKSTEEAFEDAWRAHYTQEDHHPEHYNIWTLFKVQKNSIFEMIIDWFAMSIKFGGNTLEWYNKNKKDDFLHGEFKNLSTYHDLIVETLSQMNEIYSKSKEL